VTLGGGDRLQGRRHVQLDGVGDVSNLRHELGELFRIERLCPIGHRPGRIRMDLHHEPIRPRSDGCPGHGDHHGPHARAMTRIRDDGQVRQRLHHRNGSEIQEITRVGIEAANTPLTEDDLVVPFRQNVLGGQQALRRSG